MKNNLSSAKAIIKSIDLSTRRKRRAATALALDLLECIRLAEKTYLLRITPNLQGSDAYAAAEETVDYLIDAIGNLADAYE